MTCHLRHSKCSARHVVNDCAADFQSECHQCRALTHGNLVFGICVLYAPEFVTAVCLVVAERGGHDPLSAFGFAMGRRGIGHAPALRIGS